MNFSDRITFVKLGFSFYDSTKGEYVEGDPTSVTVPCKISTLDMERTNEIFGTIDRIITVARLQNPYNYDFDHVEIDKQEYRVLRQSDYRKGVFFLEGIKRER